MMPFRDLRASSENRFPEPGSPSIDEACDEAWLRQFHEGAPAVLEACYRACFGTVSRAIGPMLSGADRETAIHEVFARLISNETLRRSFRGGSLTAWLGTVARHHAIDLRRRIVRETGMADQEEGPGSGDWEQAAEARLLVERFRRQWLPPQWLGVFELRFLQQLPQAEAAARLSMRRTTLAYRELRIRRMLKRFLVGDGRPPPAGKGVP
jgi:RNA polymerase sigma-70 factor, ECF subfamily